jgi:hypothetical protein
MTIENITTDVFLPSAVVTDSTVPSCGAACDFEELWHPYIFLFICHCLVAAAATVLSFKAPKVMIGVMLASGLAFLISAIFDLPMWGYNFGDYYWWGVFAKWVIVNALATVPVLALKAYRKQLTTRAVRNIGICVYFILGSNVIWTLFAVSEGHIVRYVNRVGGCFLTVALLAHCVAICKHGRKLVDFNPVTGFPYGYGTPLPWLVGYTTWNVLFIIGIATGSTLQDILFWAIMFAYWYVDNPRMPIEVYFFYGRPVQLGISIAFAEWAGTFIPYFKDSPTLKEHHPLNVNGNGYIFFISCANLVWSLVVFFWSVQSIFIGFPPPRKVCQDKIPPEDHGTSSEEGGSDTETFLNDDQGA